MDRAVRAITEDGAFRVIVVDTTETVLGILAAQKAQGESARTFAELVTATVLLRETMAPDLRVQAILQGDDRKSRMVADSHPEGATRGLLRLQDDGAHFGLERGALLQMMRTLHDRSIHQGVVEVPPGKGVGGALMEYLQASEQISATADVGTCVRDGNIIAAGGYLVQLLPEYEAMPLAIMTERLAAFPPMNTLLESGAGDPEGLLSELLYGMPYGVVGQNPVAFRCQCDDMRVVASLGSLPKRELLEMVTEGKVLEIQCDYCSREYRVHPETLRGLLSQN